MTKDEIISRIFSTLVPPNARLLERDIAPGLRQAEIHKGDGSLELVIASSFIQDLRLMAAVISDKSKPQFLRWLHACSITWHLNPTERLIGAICPSETRKMNHKKVVDCLEEIAKELQVRYKAPQDDPLL